MSNIKDWLIQIGYPYTAGVIVVIWIGTAVFSFIEPDAPLDVLIGLVALATLMIAAMGFSAKR